ncbi:porin family protein [Marinilabiliaceae bacterium JC017]|nr:porin family protein [Marinilabiliaceae bacterium JC017]
MKKLLTVVAVMAIFSSVSFAQFKIGGGLTMGTKMGIDDDGDEKMGVGINVRGDYYFSEKFSVSPGFTYFFPGAPDGIDLNAWQINTDAHYHFYSNDVISVYGLGGLNYSHTKTEVDVSDFVNGVINDIDPDLGFDIDFGGTAEETDGEVGFDIGAGVNFSKFFGELKYDTAFEQVAITVGVLF